jgi:hypothetical protein
MIIALLSDSSKVETLLNNLSEADFDLSGVSVILANAKVQHALAREAGPFARTRPTGLGSKLVRKGVSSAEARAYVEAVRKGKAFVAIECPKEFESRALEMVKDYAPQRLKVLR